MRQRRRFTTREQAGDGCSSEMLISGWLLMSQQSLLSVCMCACSVAQECPERAGAGTSVTNINGMRGEHYSGLQLRAKLPSSAISAELFKGYVRKRCEFIDFEFRIEQPAEKKRCIFQLYYKGVSSSPLKSQTNLSYVDKRLHNIALASKPNEASTNEF